MNAPTVKPAIVTVACALEHVESQGVSITSDVVGAMNTLFTMPHANDEALERLLILTGEMACLAGNVAHRDNRHHLTFGGVMLVTALDALTETADLVGVQL